MRMVESNPTPTLLQPRLSRCPHCGIANPGLEHINDSDGSPLWEFADREGRKVLWTMYWCTTCAGVVTMRGPYGASFSNCPIASMYPVRREPATELPDQARRYLQQAMDTIAAPDAAVLIASSAVDAMLKVKGYKSGSLFSRITEARDNGLLTPDMADWAHEVRLAGNETRHADEENPHATSDQARQIVEFAEALGEFLFVLPARIKRARTGGGKP